MSHEYDYRSSLELANLKAQYLNCVKSIYHLRYPTQDLKLRGIPSMLKGVCPHVGFFLEK